MQNTKPKKKVNLKKAVYILLITTIIALITSMAKFGEVFVGSDSVIVAMPVFSSTTVDLESIYPDMETKKYELVLKNTEDAISSQVSLDYTINITNFGNVPLDIKLYKTNNGEIVSENLLENGKTKSITMEIGDVTHTYELDIEWDKTKENYKSYEYSGETSLVEIKVDAVQKD